MSFCSNTRILVTSHDYIIKKNIYTNSIQEKPNFKAGLQEKYTTQKNKLITGLISLGQGLSNVEEVYDRKNKKSRRTLLFISNVLH